MKIISGGQTGADQGGLAAGKALGLETGGTAPYSFWTEDGSQVSLLKNYGLKEGEPDARIYPKRTKRNVLDSDGTVLFGNPDSPGSKLTIRYCKDCSKPYIENPSPTRLRDWIKENNINILNVAGNRESTNPGIFLFTKNILLEALKEK